MKVHSSGYNRILANVFAGSLAVISLALCPFGVSGAEAAAAPEAAGPGTLDKTVKGLLKKYDIPGATLAVMKDGRLVYAEAYGYADESSKEKARPETLFRIASVSKTITAVATLMLVQEGKLSLDDKAFEFLDDLEPLPGDEPDPRLGLITVRDLLRHSGGWDKDLAGDPQYLSLGIAAHLGTPSPPDARAVIRVWIGQPLQYDPGTRYCYANFGYNVLGRIIEKKTAQSYESSILSRVLFPAGVRRMQLGHSLKEQRASGEGAYHPAAGAEPTDSVFPSLGKVPQAYGGSGGQPQLLSDETLAVMTEYQGLPGSGQSPSHYYALGWNVDSPGTPQEEWSHSGALENCNATLLTRRADGISYAVLFNTLPSDVPAFFEELTPAMRAAVNSVGRWPDKDLFPKYP
jgi:N-acyl-D-amino-acid deacylase